VAALALDLVTDEVEQGGAERGRRDHQPAVLALP
jgi:hypothetical protein